MYPLPLVIIAQSSFPLLFGSLRAQLIFSAVPSTRSIQTNLPSWSMSLSPTHRYCCDMKVFINLKINVFQTATQIIWVYPTHNLVFQNTTITRHS